MPQSVAIQEKLKRFEDPNPQPNRLINASSANYYPQPQPQQQVNNVYKANNQQSPQVNKLACFFSFRLFGNQNFFF